MTHVVQAHFYFGELDLETGEPPTVAHTFDGDQLIDISATDLWDLHSHFLEQGNTRLADLSKLTHGLRAVERPDLYRVNKVIREIQGMGRFTRRTFEHFYAQVPSWPGSHQRFGVANLPNVTGHAELDIDGLQLAHRNTLRGVTLAGRQLIKRMSLQSEEAAHWGDDPPYTTRNHPEPHQPPPRIGR